MLVPAVWSLEIAIAVLVAKRRKFLKQPEIKQFTTLLESLSLVQDTRRVANHVNDVLPLARTYRLRPNWNFRSAATRHWQRSISSCKKRRKHAGIKIFAGDAE